MSSSNSARSIEIQSSGAGSGSNGRWKNVEIARRARVPERNVIWAWGFGSISRHAVMIDAVSRTVPADVIQELMTRVERKNGNDGWDVWLSSISTNQFSHPSHCVAKYSRPRMRCTRIRNSSALGGEPARTSSFITEASRRENAP